MPRSMRGLRGSNEQNPQKRRGNRLRPVHYLHSCGVAMAVKFPAGTVLTHRKGGTYTVVITPDIGQLEETREPAYGYLSHTTGKLIFRSQAMMEDGRFTRVEATP